MIDFFNHFVNFLMTPVNWYRLYWANWLLVRRLSQSQSDVLNVFGEAPHAYWSIATAIDIALTDYLVDVTLYFLSLLLQLVMVLLFDFTLAVEVGPWIVNSFLYADAGHSILFSWPCPNIFRIRKGNIVNNTSTPVWTQIKHTLIVHILE